MEALFAVPASVPAVLKAEEQVELAVDSGSARSGGVEVMPGHLELVVVYFGLVVEFVEEREQLEVVGRPGWTALVIQPSVPVMPLACDDWIEASAGY